MGAEGAGEVAGLEAGAEGGREGRGTRDGQRELRGDERKVRAEASTAGHAGGIAF